jgi:Brp/Blh family beta-carotene 15,15'-monooxygenase
MEKINFRHSLIFFNFCIFISPFYFLLNFEPIIFCLILILILGVSHGAFDNVKGEKLLRFFGYRSLFSFYLAYIIISILIIFFWLLFPNTVLLLFLIVAAFHFGKEDTTFSFRGKFMIAEFLYFLKGSAVIIAPLLFQNEKTLEIFRILNFYVFESNMFTNQFLITLLCLSFLSSLFLSNEKSADLKGLMMMDFFSLIILNLFLTPVLAFTIYFCFLHSVRHSITLIFELDKSLKSGLKKFIYRAIPLTFVTGVIFLMAVYFLSNFYGLNDAIYKVIFIGLASLTFPHILLEYLLEKNEKRT